MTKQTLNRYTTKILERLILPKKHTDCVKKHFGTRYGGWHICTEDINPNSVIYSFGIGEDISFDLGLINEYGVTIHAFDPTPRSVKWLAKQELPEEFNSYEYGLADFNGTLEFVPPNNPEHVSYKASGKEMSGAVKLPVKNLASIKGELGHDKIDILKMDIEGSEYKALSDILHSGIFPKQILVEFHHRFSNFNVSHTKRSIELLIKAGYDLFHVSPNYEDFCFIKLQA